MAVLHHMVRLLLEVSNFLLNIKKSPGMRVTLASQARRHMQARSPPKPEMCMQFCPESRTKHIDNALNIH